MDETDKKILYMLLLDGRAPLAGMAEELGMSVQSLNYRYNKLLNDGVIKKFVLHVSPEYFGKKQSFAAFRTEKYYSKNVFSRFHCLEDISIFGFISDDHEGLEGTLEEAYRELGIPVMNYTPPEKFESRTLSSTDLNIIEMLKENPRAPVTAIAKRTGRSYSSTKKRIENLRDRRIAAVIPILDLSKTDAVIFLLFSDNSARIIPAILSSMIFQISDGKSGIAVCFADSLQNAKKRINDVRGIDGDSQVMVVYDYDFLV